MSGGSKGNKKKQFGPEEAPVVGITRADLGPQTFDSFGDKPIAEVAAGKIVMDAAKKIADAASVVGIVKKQSQVAAEPWGSVWGDDESGIGSFKPGSTTTKTGGPSVQEDAQYRAEQRYAARIETEESKALARESAIVDAQASRLQIQEESRKAQQDRANKAKTEATREAAQKFVMSGEFFDGKKDVTLPDNTLTYKESDLKGGNQIPNPLDREIKEVKKSLLSRAAHKVAKRTKEAVSALRGKGGKRDISGGRGK